MPIRLNLLAEAQAAEELRRKDPVKRAIWLGSLLVICALGWSGYLYLQQLVARSTLSAIDRQIAVRTNEFKTVQDNLRKSEEIRGKLGSLRQLATNRFLQGSLLNGLQHVTVEDVQLMRMKVDQAYFATEGVKPKTNSEGRITPGKPATVREVVSVTLDAKDSSAAPGDQINKFKDAFSADPYFQSVLSKTNPVQLKLIGSRTTSPEGKPFVLFTLELRYPENTR